MFAVLLVRIAPHLGRDGAVLVLVEDGERLLERLELVGRQRLEDLSAVRLRESRHLDCFLFEQRFRIRSLVFFTPGQIDDFRQQGRRDAMHSSTSCFPAAGLEITSGGSARCKKHEDQDR